jgi:hypothetical protein
MFSQIVNVIVDRADAYVHVSPSSHGVPVFDDATNLKRTTFCWSVVRTRCRKRIGYVVGCEEETTNSSLYEQNKRKCVWRGVALRRTRTGGACAAAVLSGIADRHFLARPSIEVGESGETVLSR